MLGQDTPRTRSMDVLPEWKIVKNRLVKRTKEEMRKEEEQNSNNNMPTGQYFQEERLHGDPATIKGKLAGIIFEYVNCL